MGARGPPAALTEPDDPPPAPTLGGAEALEGDHPPHVFLYVPDLSSQTGWTAHPVPDAEDPPRREPAGFRIPPR